MDFRILFLTLVLTACPSGSGDSCAKAETQVEDCLAQLCGGGDAGPFCACHLDGQHLPSGGACECAAGSVWSAMQGSVCDDLDGDPTVDCAGLQATVRRFELVENCP